MSGEERTSHTGLASCGGNVNQHNRTWTAPGPRGRMAGRENVNGRLHGSHCVQELRDHEKYRPNAPKKKKADERK